DAVPSVFLGHPFRQCDDPALARRISRSRPSSRLTVGDRTAVDARDRGDVDDRPCPGFGHMRVNGGPDEVEGPAEVGLDVTLPLLGRDLVDTDPRGRTGVVDEDVEATEGLDE